MKPTKTILVTGCSADGIGAAMALALARRGHHVFATARQPAKISETLRSLPNVTALPMDVADATSVAEAARAVADTGRGLDVLVNNAGIEYVQPVLDVDITAAQRMLDVNLWGPVRAIQAFADPLIASRGRIVNVSSTASVVNLPWVCKLTVRPPTYLRHCVPLCLNILSCTNKKLLALIPSFLFFMLPSRQSHGCLADTQGVAKRRTPRPRPR